MIRSTATLAVLHGEPIDPRLAVFAPVDEVAEPVGDQGITDSTGTEHPVRVAPDDDVRARVEQCFGEVALLTRGAECELGSPVEKHDQRVDPRADARRR